MSEPSGRGHTVTESGGTPIGRRARLPSGATEPIRVFINGVEQKRGVDYDLEPGGIRFPRADHEGGQDPRLAPLDAACSA